MKNFSQKNFINLILKVVVPKTSSSSFTVSKFKLSEFLARSVLCISRAQKGSHEIAKGNNEKQEHCQFRYNKNVNGIFLL